MGKLYFFVKRVILFCLFVFLLPVVLAVLLLNYQAQPKQLLDIGSRLEAEPLSLYIFDNRFNLEPQGKGEYHLPIQSQEPLAFRFLSFENLSHGDVYQIHLLWKQHDQLLLEQSPKQGINGFSVILPQQLAGTEDLELVIQLKKLEQPGMINHSDNALSFTQILLKSDFPQARLQHAFNTWFNFVPVGFHSINYWRSSDTPTWLLLPTFIYLFFILLLWRWLQLSGNCLIATFLLFFVVFSSPYWFNQWRLFKLQEEYHSLSGNTITESDGKLLEIAAKVLTIAPSDKPLLIVKEDDFERTRLAYHLSSRNVYHMPFIDNLLLFLSQVDSDYWLLIETRTGDCQFAFLEQENHQHQVLWQRDGYCLLSLQ